MDWMWTWMARVRDLVFRGRWDREVEQEMAFHVEMDTRERMRQGIDPDEARRSALVVSSYVALLRSTFVRLKNRSGVR